MAPTFAQILQDLRDLKFKPLFQGTDSQGRHRESFRDTYAGVILTMTIEDGGGPPPRRYFTVSGDAAEYESLPAFVFAVWSQLQKEEAHAV
jgi:hypothetical protein